MNEQASGWERETVINFCDAEPDTVSVWTSQRKVGVWLEKVCKSLGIPVARTSRPTWDASGLPASLVLLRKSIRKPRKLSDEQRAAMGLRLAKAREAKGGAK